MASGSQRVTTYSSNALIPKLNSASLSNFTDSQNLIYTYYGGSNSIGDKPTNVDAFGVMSFKTAAGWYGQLLMSSNQATGLYWRTGTTLNGGWKKILNANGDTMTGQLYINYNQDVGLNQNGSLVIGAKNGENIGIDDNEIMARNNSAASTLYINSEGGNVYIGSGGVTSVGTITSSAGYLKSTLNGNTITIGSQNTSFAHIQSSANIPFYFNRTILIDGDLGNTSYPVKNITMGKANGAGIYYQGSKANYRMIRFIDNTSDNYGNGISIGGGGQTIIGGGESADTAAAQAGTAGAEIMQVCNDGNVEFISNLQNGWDNRKVMTLNTSGYLLLPSYINVPTSNNENPTVSQFIVTNGSDHYYRKASVAHIVTALDGQHKWVRLAGDTMSGDLLFSNSGTTTRQVRGIVGDNDYWRIAGGATAANAGWMEIATADDGNEPVYVRQYTGAYTTIKRTLTLLDASGHTSLPGNLTMSGNLTISHTVSADMAHSSANPKITFSESGAQPVHIIYCDWDSYRAPAGLKIVGGTSATPAWFEVEGNIYNGGSIYTTKAGECGLEVNNTQATNPNQGAFIVGSSGNLGIYSRKHSKWVVACDASGNVSLNGNAATATKANGLADGSSTMTSAYNKAGLNYGDYTWLAGWNGYELRAVNKSQFAQASHSHNEKLNQWFATTGSTNAVIVTHNSTGSDSGRGQCFAFGNGNGTPWFTEIQYGSTYVRTIRLSNGMGATSFISATQFAIISSSWDGVTVCQSPNSSGAITAVAGAGSSYSANGTNYRAWIEGNSVTGAVWNDYAENREAINAIPGQCVYEIGDDTLKPTEERLSHFAGIVSDTWGFSQGETETAKSPIAVAGRVLAYTYRCRDEYKPGDVLCAAPGGTVDIMTREEIQMYPDRIVGTVSCVPDYETWGGGEMADREPVEVDGRIWVKVK